MNISQLSVISPLNPGDVSNYSLVKVVNDTEMRREIGRFIQNLNYWLLIVECLVVFFGICGNLLALVVINRRSLRDTSSSVFITYLAVFDSSVLLVHLTSLITSRFVRSTTLHCLLAYLTDFVTFSSIWIMVIMTIERCIAVHSPFSAKRLCTIQRARYSMYILLVIDFLLCTVSFPFIYTVDESQRKCGVRQQYQTILRIVKPTLFYFVPDLILLINLFIIYELFIARRQRAHTLVNPENAVHQIDAATFNRKQLQLTVMLVTVSLSFYLFTTPAIIDYIRQRNPPTYRDVKRLKMRFLRTNFTVLWLQMSSAVSVNREISPGLIFFLQTNFLFYCLAGSKFRTVCLETVFDLCQYLRHQIGRGSFRRRRNSTTLQANSHYGLEMHNGLGHNYRHQRPSMSNQPTYTYQLSQSFKRRSSDATPSSQLSARRVSNAFKHADEV